MGCVSTVPSNPKPINRPDFKPQSVGTAQGFKLKYKTTNEILGSGSLSVVKTCISKSSDDEYAVKIISRADLLSAAEESVRSTVKLLETISFPNIIQIHDFFEEDKFFYIVMDIARGGELFDRIESKGAYSERQGRNILRNLLTAIDHLHSRNIVHRDIKPESVLFVSKEDNANILLSNFGFATTMRGSLLTTEAGTLSYMAPEMIDNKPYGPAVDMWSFGVLSYVLLSGSMPFADTGDELALANEIRKGNYSMTGKRWKRVSDSGKEFISLLLTVDPEKRLTSSKALSHPWMNIDIDKLEN